MARPSKIGLDYFPMDTDYYTDDKFRFVFANYGLIGEAVISRLFAKAYRTGGFINWSDDDIQLFACDVRLKPEEVKNIISEAIKRKLFDETMLIENLVLTSTGIQRRYEKACIDSGRKITEIDPKYNLLTSKQGFADSKQEFTPGEIPQSKVKKKKIKEKEKEKESDEVQNALTQEQKDFEIFQKWILKNSPNVSKMDEPFTIQQYQSLILKFDDQFIKTILLAMHNYTQLLTKCRNANITFKTWAKNQKPDPIKFNWVPNMNNR